MIHKLSGELVEVLVDLESSVVVQVTNRLTKAQHLFSRKPELALKGVPPMGIVEVEPFYCSNWVVREYTDNSFIATCTSELFEYAKKITTSSAKAQYTYCVKNRQERPLEARLRVALYLACGKGGFWGDEGVLGATYSCRYYVLYGYGEDWGTFSTSNTPGTPKGFTFEKHSYRSKWFPELKWVAVVDKNSGEGIVVKCLNGDCYGVVENQFFNFEANLAIPTRKLYPREEVCVTFELIPFSGIRRVDYVGEDFIVGVESPSVVTPGQKCTGYLSIFPLKDNELRIRGRLVHIRGMQSIGKRGYCVDRVLQSKREQPLILDKFSVAVEKYKPVKIKFESTKPLTWSFEEELYEIPYVVFTINDAEIRRAFSINPDVEDALAYAPTRLEKIVSRLVEDNPAVESEFMEREASKPIYEVVLHTKFNPKKIIKRKTPIRGEIAELIAEYLSKQNVENYVELWQERARNAAKLSLMPFLNVALYYLTSRSIRALRALENAFKSFSSLVFEDEYVTYFTPIHGGGGVDRFADMILALDLVEDELSKDVVEDTYTAIALLGREISKISNTWTGNWELSEAAALLAIAYKLGYPGSDIDVHRALATAKRALDSFLPDGAWPELAPSYHTVSLSHLVKIGEISAYAGLFDVYNYKNSAGEPVIKKALAWLWETLTPRNTAPALEDANEFTPQPDLYLLPGLHLRDAYLLGVAFELRNAIGGFSSPYTYLRLVASDVDLSSFKAPPKPPQRKKLTVFEHSGRFVYREAEDLHALYLVLDFGPQGGWHGHPDRLSFELYYKGTPIIVDAGCAGYYNPLHWTWSRKSIAHNTVTSGEKDHYESFRGYLVELRELSNGFYAVLHASLDESTKLERKVLLSSTDKVLAIHDTVLGAGLFRWNIHCSGTVKFTENNVIALEVNNLPYMVVIPEDQKLQVAKGYRGSGETVPYVYYESHVSGVGELWGVVVLDEQDTKTASKKAIEYLSALKKLSPSPKYNKAYC